MRGRRRYERLELLGLVFGFGRGCILGLRGFLSLFDLVLEFGVEGLALLDGQLALLDEIVDDFLALLNSGRQGTEPARKTLRRPSPKLKSAMMSSFR